MLRRSDPARHVRSCCRGLAGAALSFLAGCSVAGDLGRSQHFATGEVAVLPGNQPGYAPRIVASAFPLTDDERQLRALARNLLAPPYDPGWPLIGAIDGGRGDVSSALSYNGEAYAGRLIDGHYRSAAARYARLIDDTRSDFTRVDPFFALGRRVADLDHKRERSLAHVSMLSQDDLANAHRRVRENMLLMSEVHRTLQQRAAMYRFALERLVIALPSPMAVEAERMRAELERRLAAIEIFAPAPSPAAARGSAVLSPEGAQSVSK